ncbi:DNA translocase FtsK [Desulfonispora thiosulfatigenes DSM 11270]|uniref:DNA translocase FtsK n=1 Tax=Desulfonispora thiosulfatigenes DSM 11270 TaxID=656914 RepID=A0A1W1VSU5_DESTI|nr:DNA translocase FtsK [Desulfonispora thiosulfatigenes]SMB96300.1 DNA translocase FtsK [Desulfonispora thiosulfatigenes DSM 11270]
MSKRKTVINELKFEFKGIILVGIALYILLSLINEPQGSYVLPEERIGFIGSFFIKSITSIAGDGKTFIPLYILYIGISIMYKRANLNKKRITVIGILITTLLTIFHLNLPIEAIETFAKSVQNGFIGSGGGVIGGFFSWLLLITLGLVGAYLLIFSIWISSLLYLTNTSLKQVTLKVLNLLKNVTKGLKEQLVNFVFTTEDESEEVIPKKVQKKNIEEKTNKENKIEEPLIISHFENEDNCKEENLIKENIKKERKKNNEINSKELGNNKEDISIVRVNEGLKDGDFNLPNVNMLEKTIKSKTGLNQRDINDNIMVLQKTLESFGVKGKVVQVSCGPAITRYEFQPAPGVKVSKIVNLADDISLSLASADVRIEAPIPGKAAIGIEVPNKEVSTVGFREVIESEEFKQSRSYLSVALGKDIAGKSIVTSLEKMPHLLIAGSTGSGKSVCMNALINSILFKAKPSEVKFIMIDPKMVELTTYNGIPHLITPVVTDPKKAASALRWAVHEMETRYEKFASSGVKDITRYNENIGNHEEGEFMPYIVVLIDELADLMMIAPADVEDAICRLAQMARAAGIHLVIATQRPSVDVITGIIKANVPSRIAFAVSSQIDSRTILDMGGAEKLLGRGDMLFYPTGLPKPTRLQGVYVSDKDVVKIVDFLKEQDNPEYLEEITNQEIKNVKIKEDDDNDELIPEATKLFIENGQASISLLQRRFRIGYNRAARIIDIMEVKGIVGKHEGSKARQVLITVNDYERIYGKY